MDKVINTYKKDGVDYGAPFIWTPAQMQSAGWDTNIDGPLKFSVEGEPYQLIGYGTVGGARIGVGKSLDGYYEAISQPLPEVTVTASPDRFVRNGKTQSIEFQPGSLRTADGNYANMNAPDYNWRVADKKANDLNKVLLGSMAVGTAPITIPEMASVIGTAAWDPTYGKLVRQYIYGGLAGNLTDAATYGITGDTLPNWANNTTYDYLKNKLGLSQFKSSAISNLVSGFANPMYLYDPTNSGVLSRYTNYLVNGKTARKLDNWYRYGLSSTAGIGAADLIGRVVGMNDNDRAKFDVFGAGIGLMSQYGVKHILPKLNPEYKTLANIYNWKVPFTSIETSDKLLRPFETAYAKLHNMYGIHNLSADEVLIRKGINDQLDAVHNVVGGNIDAIRPYVDASDRLFSYDGDFAAVTNSSYPLFANSRGKFEYKPGTITFPIYRGKSSWIHTLSPRSIYGTARHEANHEINANLGLQTGIGNEMINTMRSGGLTPLTIPDRATGYYKLNPELKDRPYYKKLEIINHNGERWYDKYSNFLKSINDKKNSWFRSPEEVLSETANYEGTRRKILSIRNAISHDQQYVRFIKDRFGFKNEEDTKMFLSGLADYFDDNFGKIKRASDNIEVNLIPKRRGLHGVIHMNKK